MIVILCLLGFCFIGFVIYIAIRCLDERLWIIDSEKRNASMKIRELAKYCESIDIDCDICEHKKECEDFNNRMKEISPYGMIEMADNGIELK